MDELYIIVNTCADPTLIPADDGEFFTDKEAAFKYLREHFSNPHLYVYCCVKEKKDRLQMALDRLVSDGPAIVKGLRQVGYHNLALRTQHDIEAIAAWLSSGRPVVEGEEV